MKTVAFHLTNAYRKLDVTCREELASALSPGTDRKTLEGGFHCAATTRSGPWRS